MGRPLSRQQFFGANAGNNIKVQFHNGSISTKGYIVRQRSSNKFVCEDPNGNMATCILVDKDSADLQVGEMSITLKFDDNTVRHAVKIERHLVTVNYNGKYTQYGWSFANNSSDGLWQIEEAGTDPQMDNSVDLEGDDFDTTYPVPGSGTYSNATVAMNGITFSNIGVPAAATGGVITVDNSVAGLLRSKYDGNFSPSSDATINTWNMNFFGTALHLADVVDTYVSWGAQTDGSRLGQNHFSAEWKGYVKVPTTQNYNFYSESDDENAFWIGTNAVSGFTNSNYNGYSSNKTMPANAANCHAVTSLTMDSTKWYPVRIWFTEFGGGCKFQIYAIGQDGTKLTGHDLTWCHNSVTNGY